MGWIEFEVLGLFCPEGADVFVGCKAFECLESAGEVVGVDEVGEVLSEVFVGLVVEALDGSFFEGSIHAFDLHPTDEDLSAGAPDLTVGPGVFRSGEAVVDVGFGAGELEGVSGRVRRVGERV